MKKLILIFYFISLCIIAIGQNQLPIISNKSIQYNPTNNNIVINFDLEDKDNTQLEIQCKIYIADNLNKNLEIIPVQMLGDIGFPITSGLNKQITITLNSGLPHQKLKVVLIALDRENIDINEIISKVDSNLLKQHISTLQGRRNTGNQSFYEQSRAYLFNTFNANVPANELVFNTPQYNCKNYEATKLGYEKPNSIICIDAHYDSFSNAPGADDNASGVAGVLEAIRILGPYASKKSVRYILFDLEEGGLVGSSIYVNNQLNSRDTIAGVINFEMIGFYSELVNSQDLPAGFNILFPDAYNQVVANNRKGDFITNVGNTISIALRSKFHQMATTYVPNLKVISIDVPGNGSIAPDLTRSDHFSFWSKNIPALMITDGANFRNKNYHTLKDSIQYLNFNFMSQVVKTAIATILDLAQIQHGTSSEFDVDLGTGIEEKTKTTMQLLNLNHKPHLIAPFSLKEAIVKVYSLSGAITQISEGNILKDIPFPICKNALQPGIYFISVSATDFKWTGKYYSHGNY